jgi:hypothetical protein
VSFEPAVAAYALMLNAGKRRAANFQRSFKELEDEASQLNRLDFRSSKLVARSRSLLGVFVGAQLSVMLLSHPGSNDILTTLLVPVQVLASVSKLKPLELATEN